MQKIRIFALAKELNMDSKDLIEVCAKVGIILKNSALASISPEEKDKVLDFLKQSSSTAPASKVAVPPVVRDIPKHVDKPLVNIMAAKPQGARLVPKPRSMSGGADDGGSETENSSVATIDSPVETSRPDTGSQTVSRTSADETVRTTATTTARTVTQNVSPPSTSESVAAQDAAASASSGPVSGGSASPSPASASQRGTPQAATPQAAAPAAAVQGQQSADTQSTAKQGGQGGKGTAKAHPLAPVKPTISHAPLVKPPFPQPGDRRMGSVKTLVSKTAALKAAANKAEAIQNSLQEASENMTQPDSSANPGSATEAPLVESSMADMETGPGAGIVESAAATATEETLATDADGVSSTGDLDAGDASTSATSSPSMIADVADAATFTAEGEDTAEQPVAPTKAAGPRAAEKAPLRRDDYIAPGGRRQPFNMVPQGTVDMSKAANKAADAKKSPKTRPGPNLPTLAAMPEYKAVVVPQPAAQKPDMKLPTGTTINDVKPLERMLKHKTAADAKKAIDDKAGVKKRLPMTLEEEIEAAGKNKAKPGMKKGAGLEESRRVRQHKRSSDDDEEGSFRGGSKVKRPKQKSFVAPAKTSSEIELPITIRSLSECIGRPAKELLKILFMRNSGGAVTINSMIDEDTAIELALEVGVDLSIRRERDLEQELFQEEEVESSEGAVTRPPIITILGHVDHGKTTLLDTIRGARVAAGEAGGITQHIAAYQVERNGHKLTFVDTPGHAAFTSMRARGASVTDIIVLVVAADDGVMPQTAEAISHAKAAGVPIVVALNKCDLAGRNEERVLQDLARHEIMPAEWGGDVEVVRTSGLTGLGIDNLLETLLLTAELHEYKSVIDAPAAGVCLEAFRDEGRGTVAWLMVQRGTLKIGDMTVCGEAVGRIRNLYNDRGEEIREAGPSTPVKVSGLDVVPFPGDKFVVTADGDAARQLVDDRRSSERSKLLTSKVRPMTLEDVLDKVKGGGVRDLPLIIKADSPGSLEALRHELSKFEHPEVRVTVVHDGVGGVNESDVYLASATKSVIIAFHVIPEDRAKILADQEGVEIRQYQIIYEVTDHIKLALEGLLKPELQQVSTGRALVLRTFFISRVGGTIAGCRVLNGSIERSNRVRVIRDHRILNDYAIGSLKREKDDAKEVREGYECGIRLENFNDVKEGDLFEAYRIEEVKRKLELE